MLLGAQRHGENAERVEASLPGEAKAEEVDRNSKSWSEQLECGRARPTCTCICQLARYVRWVCADPGLGNTQHARRASIDAKIVGLVNIYMYSTGKWC